MAQRQKQILNLCQFGAQTHDPKNPYAIQKSRRLEIYS